MARPIKETPILYGKEAEEFEKRIKEDTSKASREEIEEAKRLYEAVKANSNFVF